MEFLIIINNNDDDQKWPDVDKKKNAEKIDQN